MSNESLFFTKHSVYDDIEACFAEGSKFPNINNIYKSKEGACFIGDLPIEWRGTGSFIEDNMPSCYNPNIKGDIGMSFAGFTFVNERIFAFSDSASTRMDDSGKEIRDYEREPIQKLFTNDRMAIITTGVNEFICNGDNKGKRVDISNIINTYMPKSSVPESVASKIFNLIQREKAALGDKILIVGISKRRYEAGVSLALTYAEISENSFRCDTLPVFNKTGYYIGDTNYITYFNYHSDLLNVENADLIKQNIENAILEMDKRLPYNPVGGNVIVKEVVLSTIT